MKRVLLFVIIITLNSLYHEPVNGKENIKEPSKQGRYTYYENDGIFMYYETLEKELYRKLLPKKFDMPERLLVYTFINDFYKMDEQTEPYKEASVFLLCRYEGQEAWHCIYMPVTSRESMLAGKLRLGLPKTMGEISLSRDEPLYEGTVIDDNDGKMMLSLNTKDYKINPEDEELLKELSLFPKYNIRNGEVIKMMKGRSEGWSIIDIAQMIPNRLQIQFGEGNISFQPGISDEKRPQALALTPSKILGAYYLLNKIPFHLGSKSLN